MECTGSFDNVLNISVTVVTIVIIWLFLTYTLQFVVILQLEDQMYELKTFLLHLIKWE